MTVVGQTGVRAQTTQWDLGQMVGFIIAWRPSLTPEFVKHIVNSAYRKTLDIRHWYGAAVRGEIVAPNIVTGGTVTTTENDEVVQGNGTAWDSQLVGRQFRVGFTQAIYTIVEVDPATQTLTLDLPWGGRAFSGAGYQIIKAIYSLGPRVRHIFTAVNKAQGWRMNLGWSQDMLNTIDSWRVRIGWPAAFVDYVPSADGEAQWEVWPWPTTRQSFPFLAYVQPTDLKRDADAPAPFLRSDVIVTLALADALRVRTDLPGYDPVTARQKLLEWRVEVALMERKDNDLLQKDYTWNYAQGLPYAVADVQATVMPQPEEYAGQW